jgi:pyruvate dehydrogenase (quinone)
VERPGDVEEAISSDFNYPCHALVDVVVNPDEPPMPAKVTYEQAKGFAESFLRGHPRRATIAATLFRDKTRPAADLTMDPGTAGPSRGLPSFRWQRM